MCHVWWHISGYPVKRGVRTKLEVRELWNSILKTVHINDSQISYHYFFQMLYHPTPHLESNISEQNVMTKDSTEMINQQTSTLPLNLASSFFWQLEPHHGSFHQNWSLVKFSSLSPAGNWKYPPSLAKSVNCTLKAHLKLFFLSAGLPSAPSCVCFYCCDMLLTWLVISIKMTSLPNFVCTTSFSEFLPTL